MYNVFIVSLETKKHLSKFEEFLLLFKIIILYLKVLECIYFPTGLRNTLVVYNLRKNFLFGLKKFSAVKDINFSTRRGQCLGLVGINGSGKSTTFNILSADMIPTSGDVIIDNVWQSKDLNKVSTPDSYYLSEITNH